MPLRLGVLDCLILFVGLKPTATDIFDFHLHIAPLKQKPPALVGGDEELRHLSLHLPDLLKVGAVNCPYLSDKGFHLLGYLVKEAEQFTEVFLFLAHSHPLKDGGALCPPLWIFLPAKREPRIG